MKKMGLILYSITISVLVVCCIYVTYALIDRKIDDNTENKEIIQEVAEDKKFQKEKLQSNATEEKGFKDNKTFKTRQYTILDTTDANRTENVKKAISVINGLVLQADEEFSFNNILGKRTEDKGYKPATVILRDKNGNPYEGIGIGGGICQVSSTIYMACKDINLEILERRPHSMTVEYCSVDDEAMVSWGTSDFRFKNNLGEDITIKLYLEPCEDNTSNQKLVCEIW